MRFIGVEAAGRGIDDRFEHSAAINGGRPGVLHGNRTYLLQNADGQILEGHSISAGLDYPGVGPEHSYLADIGRAQISQRHGRRSARSLPTLRQARRHPAGAGTIARAGARWRYRASEIGKDGLIIMNLCGRGDKDVFTVADALGVKL